jgi:hypothetical protein
MEQGDVILPLEQVLSSCNILDVSFVLVKELSLISLDRNMINSLNGINPKTFASPLFLTLFSLSEGVMPSLWTEKRFVEHMIKHVTGNKEVMLLSEQVRG